MPDEIHESLLDALTSVSEWISDAGFPAVIVGGVAASLLGRPRFTRDIDALADLPEDAWAAALESAARFGLDPRLEDPIGFARRSRVLLLRHRASEIEVDVILGTLPFERDAVARGEDRRIGGLTVRLPRVEDLLIMKAIAHRPRDVADLEGLLQAHPKVDIESARRWIREFATAATMPELLADFDAVVKRVRK